MRGREPYTTSDEGVPFPNGFDISDLRYAEATITSGACGYLWAAHFGGGEIQEEPCRRPAKEKND